MKTENTLANKAKFFALYWGQNVLKSDKYGLELVSAYFNPGQTRVDGLKGLNYCLELNPLTEIKDDEIKYLDELMGLIFPALESFDEWRAFFNMVFAEQNSVATEFQVFEIQKGLDYLRSKGYALPWMDLSINDLLEYGWIDELNIVEHICIGCDEPFNIDEMEEDSAGERYCTECWKLLSPVMKAEYEEMKAKGEID